MNNDNKQLEMLKQKYMERFCRDFLNLNEDGKVILENERIKLVFGKGVTNQVKELEKRLGNYGPFMISDSRFEVKEEMNLEEFYKEFKTLLENSDYKTVLMFYSGFKDKNGDIVELEGSPGIDYCHQKNEHFFVYKSQGNDIESYITNNIKQKRRTNYRKSLKTYGDDSRYNVSIKYAESFDEIKEFEDFCFQSFIEEKFGNKNYMRLEHNQMFYRFCFEEGYKVILFKIYDEDKLIGCEYALEIEDTLYCLFGYEDTKNYDGLGVFLILKEIEFMLKSDHLKKCDFGVDDCGYKSRMGMKKIETYFTYLTNKNYGKN